MFVMMLETRCGSENGHALRRFERGKAYEIADTLARFFIRSDWAKEVRRS